MSCTNQLGKPLQSQNLVFATQRKPEFLIVLLIVMIGCPQEYFDGFGELKVVEVPVVGHKLEGLLGCLEPALEDVDEIDG